MSDPQQEPRARRSLRAAGVRLAPVVALGALAISLQLHGTAVVVLAPEVSRGLDVERETLAGVAAIEALIFTLATLPMASLARRRIRGVLSGVTGAVWSVAGALAAFATQGWHLFAAHTARGAAGSSTAVVHGPLLLDLAPPGTRARVLTLYQALVVAGGILAPLTVAGLAASGLGWQGVIGGAGLIALVLVLPALWLRDPGVGRFEVADATAREETTLGVFEAFHRLLRIPTMRRILVATAVLGAAFVPLLTFLLFFLKERWGMSPGARGVFIAAMPLFSIPALVMVSRPVERMFAEDPRRVVRLVATLLAVAMLLLGAMVAAPVFPLMFVAAGLQAAAGAALRPAVDLIFLSVAPPLLRPHASALAGLYYFGIGGLGGLLALSGVDRRFGPGGAIVALVVPGLIAALVVRSAAASVVGDLAARDDEAADREAATDRRARGDRFPLLSLRRIRVAFDGVEVLRGVDLDVEEGELVAILGTNGAGKTTLLRAATGLVPVAEGVVRVDGEDITHLETERRVRLAGMVHVPAAEGSFPDLTVAENLALFGFREGARAERPEVFEAFPVLERRLRVPAGRLSGGERRMLALAQALVIRARLVLIDELSFGVSPRALPGLLDRVRALHAQGATILLVEQSPAVAAEIAPRAVFLHEGRVRFDGATRDLLQRKDLLQPVFLGGPGA